MKLTTKQYAIALHQQLLEAGVKDHEAIFSRFIRLLASKNRLSLLPQIAEQLKRHHRAEQGIQLVKITTAKALPEATLKKFKKRLQEELKLDIELQAAIDEKIIGGAVLQLDDTIIDSSIAQALSQLNATLAKPT